MKRWMSLILVGALMVGCKANEDSSSTADENLTSSVEDAVTTMSALMDDQEGESYATNIKKSYPEMIDELIFPKAYAAGCIRPVHQVCDNGSKSSVFQDCSIFGDQVLASGQIDLEFSQNDCSMALVGDQVARTFDFELVGPRGGQMTVSSAEHSNYSDIRVGGGAEITKTNLGWDLDILGKHKVFTRNGRVRMDKSIQTLSPLEISGGLRRSQRQVNNGQLQVHHNLAEFTALYTAQDLRWSSSCCHPVSGTLTVEYTGSRTGSATVEFGSCGTAELEKDGEIHDVQFSYCE